MRYPYIGIIASLFCTNVYAQIKPSPQTKPLNFIAQIDRVDGMKTAIDKDMKLLLADRYYFKTETPCNGNTLSARPESLGLTTRQYIDKIEQLEPAILDDRYFLLTIDQCDSGGTPMLTGIEICTEALCGTEYIKKSSTLWLNEDLKPTLKRLAAFSVHLPLTYDEEKKLWKVTGWYITKVVETGEKPQNNKIAFEGYTDKEHFETQRFISGFTSFYPDGTLKQKSNYNAQGELEGDYESYFENNGKLFEKLTFKNGKPDGVFTVYHENGTINSKREFTNGKIKDGECPHFYDNGKIKQQHSYLNQKLEGPAFEYFPDGKVKEESFYSKGNMVGKNTEYYPSGKIRSFSNKNAKSEYDGTNETFTEEGQLLSKSTYKDGNKVHDQWWYDNGKIKEEIAFDDNGLKNGINREWYKNGNLYISKSYKHDVLDGMSERWHEDGQPEYAYPYKDGEVNGEARHWNKNGKLTSSTEYKNGIKEGADRDWSVNTGKMTEEKTYSNDELHGLLKKFNDRTGKILSVTPYAKGDREGTEENYDENGIEYQKCFHKDKALASLYYPAEVTQSAIKGDPAAQFTLGEYEYNCTNYTPGIKWLTQSAEQKNTPALLLLAKAYHQGQGVPQNKEKYLSYLLQAAEHGNSEAQLEIGYLYAIGEEVEKNFTEAFKWVKKSADQDYVSAHYILGIMYRNGDGVVQDLNKAKSHFTIAARGGDSRALEALKEIAPKNE